MLVTCYQKKNIMNAYMSLYYQPRAPSMGNKWSTETQLASTLYIPSRCKQNALGK